ncbi:MAG: HEPN domain-containing protein [Verrucomicrobia bacterium]|nr:HEPN domain-containing protein [Prolixibacteraceae bacterium]
MIGDSDDLIKYRLSRSLETIHEAETMIENGYWNASVNRIYYACYYAVSGLLLKKSIETNSHKGIRQMFGLHFVHTGLVPKEDGRFFSDLYDRRQTGDYEDFILYDEEIAMNLFHKAKEFIARMIELASDNTI